MPAAAMDNAKRHEASVVARRTSGRLPIAVSGEHRRPANSRRPATLPLGRQGRNSRGAEALARRGAPMGIFKA